MCEKCLQNKKDKGDDLISQFTDQIQTALITNRQVHAVLYHPNLGFCHKKSFSRRVNDIPNDKHTFSEKKMNQDFCKLRSTLCSWLLV